MSDVEVGNYTQDAESKVLNEVANHDMSSEVSFLNCLEHLQIHYQSSGQTFQQDLLSLYVILL